MNENDLILGALRLSAPTPHRRKRKVMKEIESNPISGSCDPIYKLSKPKKIRRLDEWKSSDFLRFISTNLDNYGLTLSGAQHTDVILRIHDLLVDEIPSLNNRIMREYFEWWIGNYARGHGDREVSPYAFTNERYIKKFAKQFNSAGPPVPAKPQPVQRADNAKIYAMGGLRLLLMKSGVVDAYKVLRDTKQQMPSIQISKEVRSFDKETVEKVMSITISSKYPKGDLVDFISIARPALSFYRIKRFDSVDYKEYFEE